MIILFPAPGAAPDNDNTDDQLILPPWEGDELFPLCEQVRYSGSLNLNAVLELQIAGVPQSTRAIDLTNDWTTCNAVCSGTCVFDAAGPAGSCATVNPYGCFCVLTRFSTGSRRSRSIPATWSR